MSTVVLDPTEVEAPGRGAGSVSSAACSMAARQSGSGCWPLNLGRKTREWNRAQRRAIAVRDGGRCRFIGCERKFCDIHHLRPWDPDGPTDIANGALLCTRHHTLAHRGYRAVGDANGLLSFHRPDGTEIGTTTPATRSNRLF